MSSLYEDAILRARTYLERYQLTQKDQLGGGIQGLVLSSTRPSAIKAHVRPEFYEREKAVYLRLMERAVTMVEGFEVPQLVGFADDLWIIEMEIVSPPFVVDFASAYLDQQPPYDAEQWEQWRAEKQEQFEDRWETVETVMAVFRRYGIYLADVKPGNIMFDDDSN